MSDMKKLEREGAKVTGVNDTDMLGSPFTATVSAIDRIEDLEHNLTVANTKMDAIIEGTDASLKQLTEMYTNVVKHIDDQNTRYDTRLGELNVRMDNVYMALGVMFGVIVLLLVVVGYLLFTGA